MTTITIATSKGGAGKTTLALAIAGTLANRGHRVAAIDADYNHSLADWVSRFHAPITVKHELDETKIIPLAGQLEEANDLLVIDTAGAAMQATVFAIGCADLVLIPCQLSSSDVLEAAKTAQLVESASRMTRRQIPARVVLMDYQPHTTIAQHVASELVACQLTALSATLNRLVAFKEMTFNGQVPTTGTAGRQVTTLLEEVATHVTLPGYTLPLAS
jgi:chromosome partitioning protein